MEGIRKEMMGERKGNKEEGNEGRWRKEGK